jgi:hypothetical protein
MSSPDFATVDDGFERHHDDVRFYPTSRFDKGARAFAFCCAVIYAVLSGGLIFAIVKATLRL